MAKATPCARVGCNETFRPRGPRQRYCCPACRRQGVVQPYGKRHARSEYRFICLACGVEFVRTRAAAGGQPQTCSGACSAWRARWGDRPRPSGRCEVCDGSMDHRAPQAKTCSPRCADIRRGDPPRRTVGLERRAIRMPGAHRCVHGRCNEWRHSNLDSYCQVHLQARDIPPRVTNCSGCGAQFGRKLRALVDLCRDCQLRQAGRDFERDVRVWAIQAAAHERRKELEEAAPGPSMSYLRRTLLARWIRQGRRCWACPAPADTIDHMVPLSRGGTNHEGNLAPACRSHNSARGARLIVEWRWRRGRHGTASGREAEPESAAA